MKRKESTATIDEAYSRLTRDAETIKNTSAQSLATMEVGDEWRQGDVRVKRLADDWVSQRVGSHALIEVKPDAQLAPGNTQGSRHLLSDLRGIRMFRLREATAIDGPIILADRPFAITHPEHGDVIDIPAGCYAFPGQRAYAEELRRTAD